MNLIYVTGNQAKFDRAHDELKEEGITLIQKKLDLTEIQAESSADISRHKAQQAFTILKQPVTVSDNSWHLTALNGFPGPYMHSVNQWFTAADWLRLMQGVTNREVVLSQFITYCAGEEIKQFSQNTSGIMLTEAQGSIGTPFDQVVSLTPDNRSIALWHETQTYVPLEESPWPLLVAWLKTQSKK